MRGRPVSKAFVAEPDGWLFCRFYQETCRYADEAGECVAPECEREAQWLAGDDDAIDNDGTAR